MELWLCITSERLLGMSRIVCERMIEEGESRWRGQLREERHGALVGNVRDSSGKLST